MNQSGLSQSGYGGDGDDGGCDDDDEIATADHRPHTNNNHIGTHGPDRYDLEVIRQHSGQHSGGL